MGQTLSRKRTEQNFNKGGFIRVTRLKKSIQKGDAAVIYLQKDRILYMYVNEDADTVLVTEKFAIYVEESPSDMGVLIRDASTQSTYVTGSIDTMETDEYGDRINRQAIKVTNL